MSTKLVQVAYQKTSQFCWVNIMKIFRSIHHNRRIYGHIVFVKHPIIGLHKATNCHVSVTAPSPIHDIFNRDARIPFFNIRILSVSVARITKSSQVGRMGGCHPPLQLYLCSCHSQGTVFCPWHFECPCNAPVLKSP